MVTSVTIHSMCGLWLLALFFLLQASKADKCETCKTIISKFKEGLNNTAKSNFGGGNTAWEERKLQQFSNSETRLVEILEGISADDKAAGHMVEEHEELIEDWFFKDYANNPDADLFDFLCINNMKVCCPNGTYGKDCEECTGGKKNPCSNNGKCDGDGTRKGTGKCKCDTGYQDTTCSKCADKFYEDTENTTHLVCKECDTSCKDICDGPGPKGCDECANGWIENEEDGCVDVDECNSGAAQCNENEYCVNNPGSFTCSSCNEACMGCRGPFASQCMLCQEKYYKEDDTCKPCHMSCLSVCTDGTASGCEECAPGWIHTDTGCQDVNECEQTDPAPCDSNEHCVNTDGSHKCSTCHSACDGCRDAGVDQCIRCKTGYTMDEVNVCKDVDECATEGICPAEHEQCINTAGSFTCQCETGYTRTDGKCVIPKKAVKTSGIPTSKRKRKTKDIVDENQFWRVAACLFAYAIVTFLLARKSSLFAALLSVLFGVVLYKMAR